LPAFLDTRQQSSQPSIAYSKADIGRARRARARNVPLYGDNRLRIGITLRSLSTLGGPGSYTEQVVRRLLRIDRRHEYLLIQPQRKAGSWHIPAVPDYPNVQKVQTRRRSGLIWDQTTVPLIAQRHDVDLLFSPFQQMPSWGSFKKVMVIHGAERYVVPGILGWRNRLRWTIMEQTTLPFVDRVISVSNTMTDDFCRALGFPRARVATIHLGVDESFRKLDETDAWNQIKDRYRLPVNFLLFVGHLFPNKNLDNLLRGFKLIVDDIPHDLLIVGGRRWKYHSVERLIRELDLERRVRSLGFIPQGDLAVLYNLASCFVFPSLYESFGLAQLEAMACGCPVVASKTGALPEIGGDAAVYCNPYDPASIADAIRGLVTDDALRQQYAARAQQRAKLFSWDKCARRTLEVLESVGAAA
jgi:glycosyltransferase involved in cell wall biosynthesis